MLVKWGLTVKAIKSHREPTLTYSLSNGINMKVGIKWFNLLLEKVRSGDLIRESGSISRWSL